MSFYMMAMRVHISLLILYAICSLGSILWCLFFRSVTGLIRSIQSKNVPGKQSKMKRKLLSTMDEGKDFLFLFDLLAHTCGLESTLRVLTHSDDTFYQICKPKLEVKSSLVLEEDKLKVVWSAADIEVWLKSGRKNSRQREIVVDSYEVTIFPAESVNNTHTVPAVSTGATPIGRPSIYFFNALTMPRIPSSADVESRSDDIPESDAGSRNRPNVYSTWFLDLNGGRTEYVITIACMIGKSRMKGEKIVTNLVPYGPEKPRSGMVRSSATRQVEIFWDPPKGEFTKYTLLIDHLDGSNFGRNLSGSDRRPSSPFGRSYSRQDQNLLRQALMESTKTGQRKVENLSYKLTTYTILGLEPGESYKMTLGTKTGTVNTRYAINDVALTQPEEVKGFRATNVTSSTCLLTWIAPESSHSCLKAYSIKVVIHDGKIFKEMAVPRTTHSFTLTGLSSMLDYDVTISALCVYSGLRSEGEKVSFQLTTLPERVRTLQLEHASTNAITVKWDYPLVSQNIRYQLTISAATTKVLRRDSEFIKFDSFTPNPDPEAEDSPLNDFENSVEVLGSEKPVYTFSKLPEIVGTGFPYIVQIKVIANSPREVEVMSDSVSETFYTRPLPATGFHLVDGGQGWKIAWMPSLTPYVTHYKIKWKSLANPDPTVTTVSPSTSESILTMDSEVSSESRLRDPVEFTFVPKSLQVGIPYKVNIYAVVSCPTSKVTIESKELHQKVEAKSDDELAIFVPNDTASLLSGNTAQ